jgi:hypothetical protein
MAGNILAEIMGRSRNRIRGSTGLSMKSGRMAHSI